MSLTTDDTTTAAFALPLDIIHYLFDYLWPESIVAWGNVSRNHYHILSTSQLVWRKLCLRIFPKCLHEKHNFRVLYRTRMRRYRAGQIHLCVTCDCTASFRTKVGLKTHIENLHQVKLPLPSPSPSPEDQKTQTKKEKKLKKMKKRNKEVRKNKWECKLPNCKKSFPRKHLLKNHMADHEGIARQFPCDWENCTKAFHTFKELHNHMCVHTGNPRPHRCNFCTSSFNSPHSLRVHIGSVHGSKEQCHMCQLEFTKKGLKIHEKRIHAYICAHTDCALRFVTNAQIPNLSSNH